jgi:hypothetical protein
MVKALWDGAFTQLQLSVEKIALRKLAIGGITS